MFAGIKEIRAPEMVVSFLDGSVDIFGVHVNFDSTFRWR